MDIKKNGSNFMYTNGEVQQKLEEKKADLRNKIVAIYFNCIKRHDTLIKTMLDGSVKSHDTFTKTILNGSVIRHGT